MSPLLLALALAASTKLGVYVAGNDTASQTLLPACPAVVVFPLPLDTAAAQQVPVLRSSCPQTQVIWQVGGTGQPFANAGNALSNWTSIWQAQVVAAGGAQGDWVEGPTEMTGAMTSTDLATYWTAFASAVTGVSLGFHPVVGGLAPGVPAAATGSDGGTENLFCETLRQMAAQFTVNQRIPWAWSYHALAATLDTSAQSNLFAYRTIQQQCAAGGATLFLTQAGRTSGGGVWGVADEPFLSTFDGMIMADGVAGAALFEAGLADRSLGPIATALAAYLQNPTLPDGGLPDAGLDAGSGGAVGTGGNFVPGGPAGNYPKSGCATTGAGFALLAIIPLLWLVRRRRAPQGL